MSCSERVPPTGAFGLTYSKWVKPGLYFGSPSREMAWEVMIFGAA